MVCHNCGKELSENARFCRHCGMSVQETAGEDLLTAAQAPDGKPKAPKKSRWRRALASLLLLCIFAGGLAVSGWISVRTWQKYNAPYREEDFAALKTELTKADESAAEILRLEDLLETNSQETRALEDSLKLHRADRDSEVLDTVAGSDELDYAALFRTKPFADAYLQYIDDLLTAFRQDQQLDSWLYPYYTYSVEYGANTYIDEDLWIYSTEIDDNDDDSAEAAGDTGKFNRTLWDPQKFYVSVYTTTLSDHVLQNGRLYVTGLDLLNTLFKIPGYVLDGAVFVKAYGGNPDPAEMEVPGWTPQDYSNFWQYAGSYLYSEHAVWTDFGLSAGEFALNWNTLTDENAYYEAYEKFMDTIAPGLDRYAQAQYLPDDEYYGGVRYQLDGREASLQEIAAAYITANPACLSELGIDPDALPSSYDSLIAEEEAQLKELADAAALLETQKNQAQRQLDGREFLLQQQETLFSMRDQYKKELAVTFWVFVLILLFLVLMAAAAVRSFFRSLR